MAQVHDDIAQQLAYLEEIFLMALLFEPNGHMASGGFAPPHKWTSQECLDSGITGMNAIYPTQIGLAGGQAMVLLMDNFRRACLHRMRSAAGTVPRLSVAEAYWILHGPYGFHGFPGIGYWPPLPTQQFTDFFHDSDHSAIGSCTSQDLMDLETSIQIANVRRNRLVMQAVNPNSGFSQTQSQLSLAVANLSNMTFWGSGAPKPEFIWINPGHLEPGPNLKFTTLVLTHWLRLYYRALIIGEKTIPQMVRDIFACSAAHVFLPIHVSAL
ncbi:MAG: hypothetical protein Q7R39_09900 [Dehalococcoidia bacterium]|nr:hypothetical protein [Dehalococcoidia bacterium]